MFWWMKNDFLGLSQGERHLLLSTSKFRIFYQPVHLSYIQLANCSMDIFQVSTNEVPLFMYKRKLLRLCIIVTPTFQN